MSRLKDRLRRLEVTNASDARFVVTISAGDPVDLDGVLCRNGMQPLCGTDLHIAVTAKSAGFPMQVTVDGQSLLV
jgi:hypothetical protein